MPMIMSAEKAAQKIIHGIRKKKPIIAFPWVSFMAVRILQILPVRLADYIIKKSLKSNPL